MVSVGSTLRLPRIGHDRRERIATVTPAPEPGSKLTHGKHETSVRSRVAGASGMTIEGCAISNAWQQEEG